MGVDNLHVNTQDLLSIANTLSGQTWPSAPVDVKPADGLPLADAAASNLRQNAEALQGLQAVAQSQNEYLHQAFINVALAYQKVDENEATRIESPARTAAVDAIPVPAPPTQMPPIPNISALKALDASGYSGVLDTQNALHSPDGGASLRTAAGAYAARAQAMGANAQHDYPTTWEGDAADAAYKRLNEYSHFLIDLQQAWQKLETTAHDLANTHESIAKAHDSVARDYVNARENLRELQRSNSSDTAAINQCIATMDQCHKESDALREQYAQRATFNPVKPNDPPFGSRGGSGSSGGPTNGSGGGAGGGTAAGTGASGATMAQPAGLQNGAGQTMGAGESGGAGSGAGSSGGGGPQGGGGSQGGGTGGAPGGGLPGGLPDGLTGMTGPLDDPSLHPAASGGGGAGGGAGGGVPSMPLQPNVGGVSVGPGAGGTAGGAGGGGPLAASASGGMGGFGGAPMHGAGHGQGGKEKKRNPGLSPDENIYAEEREWTEPVIGQRRRRDVADTSKDSK
jgi:hypothetical protein